MCLSRTLLPGFSRYGKSWRTNPLRLPTNVLEDNQSPQFKWAQAAKRGGGEGDGRRRAVAFPAAEIKCHAENDETHGGANETDD
jgi:hypothetical protein